MSDCYRTLTEPCEWRQKIERSEFLAIAFPVATESSFFEQLQALQKLHFDATHHCWAFRLFHESRARSSDAGEPSGSAGKPILAALEGADVHDAGVVVVRWYGGVKLGTGGLSRAYRETAALALQQAVLTDRFLYARLRVIVPFDSLGVIYRLIAAPDILLVEERFGERNEFFFDVRRSAVEGFSARLTELRLEHEAPGDPG
jgi:uncharacterized YigZ family protein